MEAMAVYELDIICILCLSVIFYKLLQRSGQAERFFVRTTGCTIAYFAFSLADTFLSQHTTAFFQTATTFVNMTEFILLLFITFNWFLYIEQRVCPQHLQAYRLRMLYMAPLLLLTILSIASAGTGMLFFVDESNVFHRGPGYNLYIAALYFYAAVSFFRPIFRGLREKNYTKRREYFLLSVFILFPACGGLLELLEQDLRATAPAIMLALLFTFITIQETQISIDPLTRLNNRYQLYKYLSDRMMGWDRQSQLFLIMIDVDDFKIVNDTYGHIEGDRSLQQIAKVLRKACGNRRCFLGRYGGDEFMIVYEKDADLAAVGGLAEEIREGIAALNASQLLKGRVSVSIGYVPYSLEYTSIQQFIEAADARMYAVKKLQKDDVVLS